MEQISEYSGTTKSVLYRYFTDRAGLQASMGEWAMDVIAKSLDDATAASAQDALTEMIHAFVKLAADSPNIYRFCDTAVNRFAPAATGGFFNSIVSLLAKRLGLNGPQEQMWAAGAIGFVRAATENWLADPGRPDEFATVISHWLWASVPEKLGVDE